MCGLVFPKHFALHRLRGAHGGSLSAGNGNAREWRLSHLLYLAAAAIILFVIVFWSALGLPPFSGITVGWVLGGIFIALANLSLGALASGAVIEYRHPTWSRLGLLDHVFMAIAITVLAGADVGVGIWLFTSTSGALPQGLFIMSPGAGVTA